MSSLRCGANGSELERDAAHPRDGTSSEEPMAFSVCYHPMSVVLGSPASDAATPDEVETPVGDYATDLEARRRVIAGREFRASTALYKKKKKVSG